MSWWDLGEHSGYKIRGGQAIIIPFVVCPFCDEKGHFIKSAGFEKKKANEDKSLHFDTLQCTNCAGYVLCLWSVSSFGDTYDYKLLPYPLKIKSFPEEWPSKVGTYWLEAMRGLEVGNWNSAAMAARSALQLAVRDRGASGKNLKEEIEDLATKGLLPPLMKDWSHELRDLGNDGAHPKPDQELVIAQDARDVVRFLDYLLRYLYTLPKEIEDYRNRGKQP